MFYAGIFGWRFDERMALASGARYLVATLDGREVAAVTSAPDASSASTAWRTFVAVESADRTGEQVRVAGGAVLRGPFELLDNRVAVCADPSGAIFGLWQPGSIQGAQMVNAPNSWNFSELNTDDRDTAERFYGEVFGWQTSVMDVGTGGPPYTLWHLPGELTPESRSIAGMSEMGDEYPTEVPAHWSSAFAVDDTDRVTARAEELGASVRMAPFDTPVGRTAVLADPHGAVFSVITLERADT